MKKHWLFFLLFFIGQFLFNACFEPTSVNYIEINPHISKPDIKIGYYTSGDTIFASNGDKLEFSFETGNKSLNGAKAIIDGTDYKVSVINDSYIELKLPNMKTGVHSLGISVFTDTKTGSLGDRFHAEGFVLTRKWVLIYLDRLDMTSTNVSASPNNGFLKIEWTQDNKELINNYVIRKCMPNCDWFEVGRINNRNQTWFIDSNYIGESAYYKILSVTIYDLAMESELYHAEDQLPKLYSSGKENFGEIEISWDRTKFYSAFAGYKLCSSMSENKYITDVNNCKYKFTGAELGVNYSFSLTMISKDKDSSFKDKLNQFTKGISGGAGEAIPLRMNAAASFTDVLYFRYYKGLYKYDCLDNKVVDSIVDFNEGFAGKSFSPNGKYYLEGYSHDSKYTIVDLQKDKIATINDFSSILGHNIFIHYSAISNTGIASIAGLDSLYVYDMVGRRYIGSWKCDNIQDVRISPNGEYIAMNAGSSWSLFHVDGKLTQINWLNGNLSLWVRNSEFLPFEDDQLWYRENSGTAHIIKISTNQEITTYQMPNTSELSLDLQNHAVMLIDYDKFTIVDLLNGAIIRDNLKRNTSSHYYDFFLSNKYLYWNQGYRTKVY